MIPRPNPATVNLIVTRAPSSKLGRELQTSCNLSMTSHLLLLHIY
jgi:hypothetical protein